ncbi:MAG: transposase [Ignavibacteria bacterium GWB2_35_12]|nr:MAG: transposase [Ignavibacteria bacterium GWA2_35_8]OGU41798.1 MAG: transposase [Ignavibacteria bacterium GWB2_35_12]OGU92600.1 MAG: transposase [Ignavibacteria bacterium RIFOXYA2_FULL_35_10]OGV24342.1 MAG: transposase [Ignavibacteria bacterium RIFOXYC2_FULL_35_21]
MANTYSQIYIHLIIVVKSRENILSKSFKHDVYKYITGIIQKRGHKLYTINGMPDHVHIFVSFNPDDSLSELMKEVKRCSSNYINENKFLKGHFSWQNGYAAFSYSKSQIDKVVQYIDNQELHHKKKTFREEYVELLKKFEIMYDSKYLFDEVVYDKE